MWRSTLITEDEHDTIKWVLFTDICFDQAFYHQSINHSITRRKYPLHYAILLITNFWRLFSWLFHLSSAWYLALPSPPLSSSNTPVTWETRIATGSFTLIALATQSPSNSMTIIMLTRHWPDQFCPGLCCQGCSWPGDSPHRRGQCWAPRRWRWCWSSCTAWSALSAPDQKETMLGRIDQSQASIQVTWPAWTNRSIPHLCPDVTQQVFDVFSDEGILHYGLTVLLKWLLFTQNKIIRTLLIIPLRSSQSL